jgi:ATP-binding cassette subfamily F protein uup
MDTLDLLEELLADYDGTLILVSHDRDFIDRLATSTIALNGRGGVVETPGGWSDFRRQNPDFLTHPQTTRAQYARAQSAQAKAEPIKAAPAPAKAAKLSYKDAHRLGELEALIPRLGETIKSLEARLADPALFTRDRAAFDKVMAELDRARRTLAAGEEEWLALEEKKEALGASIVQ